MICVIYWLISILPFFSSIFLHKYIELLLLVGGEDVGGVFSLLLLFFLLSNISVLHLWKLENNWERTKNISNPKTYSFFISFFFIFHSKSAISVYLSSRVWIFRLCKLLFLSLYTLTLKEKNDFYLSNCISTNFLYLKLSPSAAESKMFCRDDSSFCSSPFLSHRCGSNVLCKI